MTREEFEIYKKELMERFYWCTTRSELHYLIKEKGYNTFSVVPTIRRINIFGYSIGRKNC